MFLVSFSGVHTGLDVGALEAGGFFLLPYHNRVKWRYV